MMNEFGLIENEILQLAKNQADVEKILPRLTTDEISTLVDKIDSLIVNLRSEKTVEELLRLKIRVSEEEYFRERIEVS